jgi:glycosyltransferase 2 family protein
VSPTRKGLLRVVVGVFVALAIGFFAYTMIDAWNATNGELPSLARILIAAGLWTVGLIAGAAAWATLLGGDRRVDHGAALLVSQLAKYVPGGVWQASGQVGLARALGVRLQRGATAFSVLAVTQAVAGCTYGLVLAATWTDVDVFLRVLMAVGAIATLFLIDRRWMVWVLHKIPKTRSASADLVPPQRTIIITWAICLVTLAATSCAYLVLLGSFGPVHQPFLVIGAYAIAWTAGFIAIPIPSGVGIREAVLATILHGIFPASVIIAASVYYRLVSVATEGVVAAIASHRVRPSRLAAVPENGADEEDD